MPPSNDLVSVRYMVDDVGRAVSFYTEEFGFTRGVTAAPAFAEVRRGKLRLLLAGPGSSAARPMPDGQQPVPGGWNRLLEHPSGNPIELFEPARG